jgi:SAM-dependent methyltransferase
MDDEGPGKCGVCGADLRGSRVLNVKEMLNGTREKFDYAVCPQCECVQLLCPPTHIENYYKVYYARDEISLSGLGYRLQKARYNSALRRTHNLAGWLFNRYFEDPAAKSFDGLFKRSDSILDVGCASGLLLLLMKDDGYENVSGCEPFIKETIHYPNGVVVSNRTIDGETNVFDVVMAHHVLEHVQDQSDFVAKIWERLEPKGKVIIRIPTSSSWAFEKFGANWYQMDAPRHMYVHSRKSVVQLLESAGFTNIQIKDDSTIWQIVSSQLYEQDLPFVGHLSWYVRRLPAMVLTGKLRRLKKDVDNLNKEGRGDQICIVAEKGPKRPEISFDDRSPAHQSS